MLNKLKNQTKQTKKQTKEKKPVKQQKQAQQFDCQEEQNTDLVDMSELKQDQNKVKQNARKKNDYQLEEKQIDVTNINLVKTQKPKVITSWVANSVDEVMKKDFQMGKIDHQFISLTDQSLNQKLLAKQKEEEEKQKNSKIVEENNMKLQTMEKSIDQLKMEKADQQIIFGKGNPSTSVSNSSLTNGISTTESAPKTFKNSNLNNPDANFKPIQKTAQQLKMEEAEAKEQELAAKKPVAGSWFNKKIPEGEKPAFKQSAWAASAVDTQDAGNSIKFAPISTTDEKQVQKKREQPSRTGQKKGWAPTIISESNGIKFAPLQQSKQDEKLQRKEQEFVFVSKKEQEERRRKKEEKEKQMMAKGGNLQQPQQQPKVA